jgi:hypothetical protein
MRQLKNGEQLLLSPLDHVKHVAPARTARMQQAASAAAAAQQLENGKAAAAAAGGSMQQHGASVLGQAQLAERMQQLQLAVQRDAAQLGSRAGQQLQAVGALQSQQVSAPIALVVDHYRVSEESAGWRCCVAVSLLPALTPVGVAVFAAGINRCMLSALQPIRPT